MIKNAANLIANSMSATLEDPEFQSKFDTGSYLEKVAFTKVSDEDKPTELEVEFVSEMEKSETVVVEAADNARADCVACGKKRAGWTEAMGVCKCASQGCSPMGGCEDGCSCGCKTKNAGVSMDSLVKSAFDKLMEASSELEEAGFEDLSAHALVLVNDLVVEAKAKKMTKEQKEAAKEKERAAKEKQKAKERAEKDKNDARDKKMKEKARAEKEKAAEKKKQEAEKAKAKK